MASEFDNISDLTGWRNKLEELLAAARAAAAQEDLDPRLEVADRLTEFIIRNPPAIAGDPATTEYDTMDRLARESSNALLLGSIQERVAAIVGRTTELATLRKQVESRTAANRESAASIRLEKARRVVDATTEAVAALIDLKKEIEEASAGGVDLGELKALAKKIDALVTRAQSLRNEVETAF